VLLGGWLLLQAPANPLDPDTPPMTKWKTVKTFESQSDCEEYREEAMQEGAELGSEAMLEQSKYLRCVASDAVTDKPKP
jgi:hypothetical protein